MIKAIGIAITLAAATAGCAPKVAPPGSVTSCDSGAVTVTGQTSAGVGSGGQVVGENDLVLSGSTPVGNCDSGVRVGFNLGTRG